MSADESSQQDMERRLLRPEEKRAPQVVPWRPNPPEVIAAAGVLTAVVVGLIWLFWTFVLRNEPGIPWRDDGVIVEVVQSDETPRADVTSVSSFDESFPWARPPVNVGIGPCKDPRFRIDGMPERGKIYSAADTLAIEFFYDAPGCSDIQVTFRGQFQRGWPWHQHWCELNPTLREEDGDCPLKFVDGEVSSNVVPLGEEHGTVTLTAVPGAAPAPVPSSPWDVSGAPASIEGLKLCELLIRVTDGLTDGSQSTQVVHVDCKEADNILFS